MMKEREAFDEIKRRIVLDPILVTADLTKPLRLECNALDFATSAVLLVKCDDRLWRPCSFISKGLSDIEHNYNIHNKEMLGIIRALEV
jgi:hypothetical protein